MLATDDAQTARQHRASRLRRCGHRVERVGARAAAVPLLAAVRAGMDLWCARGLGRRRRVGDLRRSRRSQRGSEFPVPARSGSPTHAGRKPRGAHRQVRRRHHRLEVPVPRRLVSWSPAASTVGVRLLARPGPAPAAPARPPGQEEAGVGLLDQRCHDGAALGGGELGERSGRGEEGHRITSKIEHWPPGAGRARRAA